MDIYTFINSINDCENIVFTLFDCNKEDLVIVETDDGNKTELTIDDLSYSDYVDYEIGDIDMWIDNRKIHIEINIEASVEEI